MKVIIQGVYHAKKTKFNEDTVQVLNIENTGDRFFRFDCNLNFDHFRNNSTVFWAPG